MLKRAILLILLISSSTQALAQQKPTPKPVTPNTESGRYRIIPMGEYSALKLDTLTGKTWKSINCPSDMSFNLHYTAATAGCWALMPNIDN